MKKRNGLILEGIVTTLGEDDVVNIAPMGPYVDDDFRKLIFRPFKTAQTYQNLNHDGEGVFHVTDDVLLLAQAAVGEIGDLPMMIPATRVRGFILQDACRFYEFTVESIDDSEERTEIKARVMASGRQRDFFGFNRAKHAIVEAAILATRLHLLPRDEILRDFDRYRIMVEKTGGPREREAFAFLERYVQEPMP